MKSISKREIITLPDGQKVYKDLYIRSQERVKLFIRNLNYHSVMDQNFPNIVEKAIAFATLIHKGQTRKGKKNPYITHPKAVGDILATVTKDDDIICSGILHDTIEDAKPYGSITKETIEYEFGPRVAKIVNDLTEQDKTLPWDVRKQQALEHIEEMDNDSLLVKSADVLHNLEDQIADYREEGESMWARFNAPKAAQLERYEKLITAIGKKWPQNPLLGKLDVNLDEVKRLWG